MGNKVQKKKTSLTDQDVMMLQLTTSLDKKEILQWHENFRKECKNGQLNKKNFTHFYKELMPNHPNADKFSEFVFEGFISFLYIFLVKLF
jgi:Ca2+-binding EF-hand superfamily protein